MGVADIGSNAVSVEFTKLSPFKSPGNTLKLKLKSPPEVPFPDGRGLPVVNSPSTLLPLASKTPAESTLSCNWAASSDAFKVRRTIEPEAEADTTDGKAPEVKSARTPEIPVMAKSDPSRLILPLTSLLNLPVPVQILF